MSSFDTAVALILRLEGGHSNDPHDPGGETNYGVTARTLASVIAMQLLPAGTTVKALTVDQAKIIYKMLYWDICSCDALPHPLAAYVFDAAVNQGVAAAGRMLQSVLDLPIDGVIGPKTVNAAKRYDAAELAALYMTERALRYAGSGGFARYGRGWLKRLFVVARSA